jgi:hypothetical protein
VISFVHEERMQRDTAISEEGNKVKVEKHRMSQEKIRQKPAGKEGGFTDERRR